MRQLWQLLRGKLCNDGRCQCDKHRAAARNDMLQNFIFFTSSCTQVQECSRRRLLCEKECVCLCTRKNVRVSLWERKRKKKKKKNSLGYITPPILVLMVGKNKITQVPSNNNNTSSNTSNNNSNTSNNTSSNTSNNNTDNNTSSNTNKKNSRT